MPFSSNEPRPRKPSSHAAPAVAVAAAALLAAAPALAQEPPPPPPAYEPVPVTPSLVYHVPPSPTGYVPRPIGDWQEGEPIPQGYYPVKRMRTPLVVAGAITLGSLYLTSALGGAIASDSGAGSGKSLLVPVFGPFAMAGLQGSTTGGFVLVLDGLGQAAGLTMLVIGLAMPKTTLVRGDVAKVQITPVPMTFGPSSAGFGFVGKF
jgi:hypothetical protein